MPEANNSGNNFHQSLYLNSTSLLAPCDPAASFPIGALYTPVPASSDIPVVASPPQSCANCRAFKSIHTPSTASGEWHCIFCLHLNRQQASTLPKDEVIDYIIHPTTPPSLQSDTASYLILVVDLRQSNAKGWETVAGAVHQALTRIAETDVNVGLITVANSLAVYQLGHPREHYLHVDTLPLKFDYTADAQLKQQLLVPLITHQDAVQSAISGLRPCTSAGKNDLCSPLASGITAAVCCMKLVRGLKRIAVLCPSALDAPINEIGVEVLEGVFEQAAAADVMVDVLATGSPHLLSPLCTAAKLTGGISVIHSEITTAFCRNVELLLTDGTQNLRCTIQVRTSSAVGVDSVIGSFLQLDERTVLLRPCQSIAMYFSCRKLPDHPSLWIQIVGTWINKDKLLVQRVLTCKLLATPKRRMVVQGLDSRLTALLVAKRWVEQALIVQAASDRKESEILKRKVGRHLYDIIASRGETTDSPTDGWFTGPCRYSIPRDMVALAKGMYNLQHGPLLGCHGTDAAKSHLLGHTFLMANLIVGALILVPELHVLMSLNSNFMKVEPVDIIVLICLAGVLDCGHCVYVWLGEQRNVAGEVESKAVSYAESLCQQRFPLPEIIVVKPGSKQEKEFFALLLPGSRDSAALQCKQLPLLSAVLDRTIANAVARCPETSRPSFYEWLFKNDLKLV